MKTLLYKYCLVASLAATTINAQAQNYSLKIDSIKKVLLMQKEDTNKVKTLNTLINFYLYTTNHAEALKTFTIASSIAQKLKDTLGLAKSYYENGMNYEQQTNTPGAINYFYKALQLYEKLKRKREMSECLFNIASNNDLEGNYQEALENYTQVLKVDKELRDTINIAFCLNSIGWVNKELGHYAESLKHYFAAVELFEKLGYESLAGTSYSGISDIYLAQRNYSGALRIDSLMLKSAEKIKANLGKFAIALANECFASAYEIQGDYNDSVGNKLIAQKMYTKALKNNLMAYNLAGSGYSQAQQGLSVGRNYTKLRNFIKARYYLENALNEFKNDGTRDEIREAYQTITTLDSTEGNYKKAFIDYQMYVLYRDSISNEENTKKSLQTKMQYSFDKKTAVAKTEQDKKDADEERLKNQQYFTIAALGFIVLAAIIIALIQFRNSKQKQQANLALKEQKEKVESTLSDLKSTQSQLIQSEKMASLGELTAGIAHEIQNPLNFVNNFSEVSNELIDEMKIELDKGDIYEAIIIANDVKQNLEKINHHGKRAGDIVKGMLQHSRSSVGVKEPTDINALCDEYLRLSYHGLRAKDKSFNAIMKTDFDENIGKINIIPQDIGRVLLNLYNNAFYAVNEKLNAQSSELNANYQPTVSVSTKRLGNKIIITVSDNGSGIPQNIIDKIFQPFFTTKPTGQGTGLGLSLSYDIVKAHGGEISAVSRGKVESRIEEGTKFIIQILE
ncbi:MAG: tetratricopeptide repeat protein [Ferruginibacter sp.]